jgi:protein TonB
MYAQRNDARRISPSGLAAAVAINAGIIAALLTASPEIITRVEPPFEGFWVPNDPPPPPPPPKPETPRVDSKQPLSQPPISTPKPRVDLDSHLNDMTGVDIITPPPSRDVLPPGETLVIDPPVTPPAPPLLDASADPRYARDFQPDYPPSERRAGNEAVLRVRVLIGEDGRVKDFQALSPTDGAFVDVTRRQALSRWRFRPATRGGVPESQWKTMTVRFRLEG